MIDEKLLENLGIRVWRKAGHDFICYCPWHDDHRPSMSIDSRDGAFICFAGCGVGRNIKELADRMGCKDIILDAEKAWLDKLEMKLHPIVSVKHIPRIPANLPLAIDNAGEEYLKSRGFVKNTIKEWNILYNKQDETVVLMIPNQGFVSRKIKEKQYKYFYGTKISEVIFWHKDMPNSDIIILVEGVFDVIWLWQCGILNAGAILGSNFSSHQKRLIANNFCEVFLMFDNDKAGEKTAKNVVNELKGSCIVKFCELPNNKDPNDLSENILKDSIRNAKWIRS